MNIPVQGKRIEIQLLADELSPEVLHLAQIEAWRGRVTGQFIVNVKVRNFKRVLRKAGLREVRYHDLRHPYASQLLAQGQPVTYVSQQLGHANPQITFKVYAHWIPNKSQRKAVKRLPSLKAAVAHQATAGG